MATTRAEILENEPAIDARLVEWLRALYPPKCIGKDETPEQAHRYAGKAELIEELANICARQREEVAA